jgi:plasmid stabilization system protein ParE
MSNGRFRFHPEANEDFREAIRWYHARNPAIATEFRITVSNVIRRIVRAPQRWPKHLNGTRRFVLDRFPFSIIYIDDPDVLTIVAVAHSEESPDTGSSALRLPSHPIQHPPPRHLMIPMHRRCRQSLSGKNHSLPSMRVSKLLEHTTLLLDLAIVRQQSKAVLQ